MKKLTSSPFVEASKLGAEAPAETLSKSFMPGAGKNEWGRIVSVKVGVLDAGVAIGWVLRAHRSLNKLERLFASGRSGEQRLVMSVVNLVEVVKHTAEAARSVGRDPVLLLRAHGVEIHLPDEDIARRVAKLPTSLADGFAAATAQELGARLHTTDTELIAQLKKSRLRISRY